MDEALRNQEFPDVVFVDGPAGRRAHLLPGPDVWQVVQAVRHAREEMPDLDEQQLLEQVSEGTGVPVRILRRGLAYYVRYPDEVDAYLEEEERVTAELLRDQERLDALLRT